MYNPFHVTSGSLTIDCPYCKRKAQEACTSLGFRAETLWGKPHKSRIRKYKKLIATPTT